MAQLDSVDWVQVASPSNGQHHRSQEPLATHATFTPAFPDALPSFVPGSSAALQQHSTASPSAPFSPSSSAATQRHSAGRPTAPFSSGSSAANQRRPAASPCQPVRSGHDRAQDANTAFLKHQRAISWAQWGVLLMLSAWFAAIAIGYFHHGDSDAKPAQEVVRLPLLWFDRQVLRRVGPFLPFGVMGYRIYNNVPACTIHGRPIGFRRLIALYASITLARWILYLTHVAELLNWVNRYFPAAVAASDHMMSDHVFLTSSIAAIFICESVFLLHSISHMREWKVVPKSMKSQKHQTYAAGGLCALLYALVVLDTYYSARHFHWRTHNNSAAFLGFVAFKLPVLALLRHG